MAEFKKRSRVDPDTSPESDSVKRLRYDLFDSLDESDLVDPASSDLDSFMRSFQDEISPAPALAVVDLTSDSGEPNLGFLLEASDDELGLPPATESPVAGIGELWRFEDELPSYDSFGEFVGRYEYDDYVAPSYGYDETDLSLDFYDDPLPLWRSETMPAM